LSYVDDGISILIDVELDLKLTLIIILILALTFNEFSITSNYKTVNKIWDILWLTLDDITNIKEIFFIKII